MIVVGAAKDARAVGGALAGVGESAGTDGATVAGGEEEEEAGAAIVHSAFCFLSASACLFGGPRRFLGRSKVHGISRAMHDWHGGPPSSHCSILVRLIIRTQTQRVSDLDFADVACITCFL